MSIEGTHHHELLNTLRKAQQLNISVMLFFTLGLPFESENDIIKTMEFQRIIRHEFGHNTTIYTETLGIDPGSPMFLSPEKYGITKTRSSFKDFVRDHAPSHKETPLGYLTNTIPTKTDGDLTAADCFENKIRALRCRHFC